MQDPSELCEIIEQNTLFQEKSNSAHHVFFEECFWVHRNLQKANLATTMLPCMFFVADF